MKVYIAGRMTGIPNYNRPAFYEMAGKLISKGYSPVHTADMPLGLEYEAYMEESFKRLKECEVVLLLDGWDLSAGAMREVYFAHQNGIRVTESLEKLEKWGKGETGQVKKRTKTSTKRGRFETVGLWQGCWSILSDLPRFH